MTTTKIKVWATDVRVGDMYDGYRVFEVNPSVWKPETHTAIGCGWDGKVFCLVVPNNDRIEVER